MVALLILIAAATSFMLFFIRTTSAASTATSVPAPMAKPMSALVNATASLIPSPTMATLRCPFPLPNEDFFSIDLMNAYRSLGLIIGEEIEDDLVEEIFSKFCLGK